MVAVFSGMLYGSGVGVLVAVVSWILRFASDSFGALMNVLAALPLVAVMAAWYRPDRSFGSIALGCVVAVAAAVTVSVCMNFVITPLYLGVSYEEVASLVVPALLPFNVVKASANVVLAVVCTTKLRGFWLMSGETSCEVGAFSQPGRRSRPRRAAFAIIGR